MLPVCYRKHKHSYMVNRTMKQAFVILAVLVFHAHLVVSAQDNSTICTNDGNCYTLSVLAPIQCGGSSTLGVSPTGVDKT